MTFSIRRASVRDTEAALALWSLLQSEHEHLDARHRPSPSAAQRWSNDFKVWVTSDAHRVLVAEGAGGALCGLATAHIYWPSPMYEQDMEVYVTELVVAPEARGAGIGKHLLDAVRTWARSLGVGQIRAGVLSRNQGGRAFWAREGAEEFYTTVTLSIDSDAPDGGAL